MTDIVWEDPPPEALKREAPGRYAAFAQALIARPNQWAVLPGERGTEGSAKGMAQNIRRGKGVKGFEAKHFETAIHGTKVWVKFVPEVKVEGAAEPQQDGDLAPETQNTPAIRAWARENGMDVPERGRLARNVVERYYARTGNGVQP